MKIAIEARALTAESGGVKTYTYELIRHLLQLGDKEHSWNILYDSNKPVGTFPEAEEVLVQRDGDWDFLRWLHRKMPSALEELQPEVVHFTKADIPKRKLFPTVVTIYDTIPLHFPESQSLSRRLYWPRALRRAATLSDHIITISNASRDDIVREFGISQDKITVTPLPVDQQRFRPVTDASKLGAVREKYELPGQFILFVGTRDPRKNIASLIRAFDAIKGDIPHGLVIAGRPALRRDNSEALVKELGLEGRVRVIGMVGAEDLPTLYSAADLFVFPSVYEGWGFPPLEAMACGTPVVASNGAPLPEVVGPAGEVVEFSNTRLQDRVGDREFIISLAERIEQVLRDPAKLAAMAAAGVEQAQRFSWNGVAEATLAAYKKVV